MKKQKILLLWIGRIGDFVVSSAFISQIKKKYPDSHVTALISDFTSEIADMIPGIDEKIIFPKKQKIRHIFPLLYKLFSNKWDVLINLNPSFSTTASYVVKLTAAPLRAGYMNNRNNCLYNIAAAAPEKDEHMVSVYKRLADVLEIPYESTTVLKPLSVDIAKADEIIAGMGVKKFIAVHPGNFGKSRSRWPEENFASLSSKIAEVTDMVQIYITGPGEQQQVKAVADAVKCDKVITAPLMNLRLTAAFLSRASLFIGNSTGTTHTADAVGTPVLCINNHYSYCCWRPLKNNSVALTSGDWDDIKLITPEDAFNGFHKLCEINGIEVKK